MVAAIGVGLSIGDHGALAYGGSAVVIGASLLLRSWSVPAAAIAFVAAVWAIGFVFGVEVRCVLELSAGAYVMFWAARSFGRADVLRWWWLLPLFLWGEVEFDPVIAGVGGMIVALLMLAMAFALGRAVCGTERRGRRLAEGLEVLRQQRIYTEELAATAERLRVHDRLQDVVDSRLVAMIDLGGDPPAGDARSLAAVLGRIQALAVEALDRLRPVLLDLKASHPAHPSLPAAVTASTPRSAWAKVRGVLGRGWLLTTLIAVLCATELTDQILDPRAENSLAHVSAVHRWAVVGATAVMVGGVAVCRRWPWLAVCLQVVVSVTFVALGIQVDFFPTSALLTLAAMAYAVGLRLPRRPAVGALIVLLVCWLVAEFGFGQGVPVPAYALVGPWVAARAMRPRARITAELETLHAEMAAERVRQARLAVEIERRHLLGEIHDVLGGALSAVIALAAAARRLAEAAPDDSRRAARSITDTLIEARRHVVALRDGDSRQPTTWSLPEMVRRMSAAGMEIRLVGEVPIMSERVGYVLHRLVQESLANALRHAPGAPVCVEVTTDVDFLTVVVSNPAPPPGATPTSTGTGAGLVSMADRVAALGGTVSAGPAGNDDLTGNHGAARGWMVRARLPLEAPERRTAPAPAPALATA